MEGDLNIVKSGKIIGTVTDDGILTDDEDLQDFLSGVPLFGTVERNGLIGTTMKMVRPGDEGYESAAISALVMSGYRLEPVKSEGKKKKGPSRAR